MKSLGITANINNPLVPRALKRVIQWCRDNRVKFNVDSAFTGLGLTAREVCNKSELWQGNDLLVSLGGDGTLLTAAQAVEKHQIPILGINLGGLGFLTQLTAKDIESGLNRIKRGKFQIERRLALEVRKTLPRQSKILYALNDAVLHKGEVAHLISFEIWVGKEFICSFTADGLIVSTPTGSTAYSLAAGGPIIHPQMEALIVTPICPQTMATRPIIFSADEKIIIKLTRVRSRSQVMVDGQTGFPLSRGDRIEIKRARHKVTLIRFPEASFYGILRQKLHWGLLPKATK
jgi:NAD+ kinase